MIRLTDEQGRCLLEAFDRLPVLSAPDMLSEMRDVTLAVKEQLDHPQYPDDLVDTIIGVLQEPHITSLNMDQLGILRKAIFSPLELATFSARIKKCQECASCGKPLFDYEAVTLISKSVRCYRCNIPEMVTCHQCGVALDVMGISKTIARALQRHTCQPTAPDHAHETNNEDDNLTMVTEEEAVRMPTSILGEWYSPSLQPSLPTRPLTAVRRETRNLESPLSHGPLVGEDDNS